EKDRAGPGRCSKGVPHCFQREYGCRTDGLSSSSARHRRTQAELALKLITDNLKMPAQTRLVLLNFSSMFDFVRDCAPRPAREMPQGFPPRRGERRIARGERAKASHPWSTLFADPGAPAGAPGAGLNSPGVARCALNPWLFSVRPSGAENLEALPRSGCEAHDGRGFLPLGKPRG